MTRRVLFVLTFLFALVLIAAPAQASPTGVSYTYAANTPTVGAVTFTGVAQCDTPTCRWQWRIYGPGFSRTGTVLVDTTQAASVATVSAVTKGVPRGKWLVSLKVTGSNGTNGYGQFDAYVVN